MRRSAAVLVALLLLGLVPAASAQQYGTVTGTVTERDTGAPLEGLLVELVDLVEGTCCQAVASARTGPDGRYTLEVPPFQPEFGYFARVTDDSAAPFPYVQTTFPDAVTPSAGQTIGQEGLVGADIRLARSGALTGVVRAAVDGAPLGDVAVLLLPIGEGPDGVLDLIRTEPDGTWRRDGLFPRPYQVVVAPDGFGADGLAETVLDGRARRAAGDPFVVRSGALTWAVDVAVVPDGGLAGRVRSPSGAPPPAFSCFEVVPDGVLPRRSTAPGGTVEEDGSFGIDLEPGVYRVRAGPCGRLARLEGSQAASGPVEVISGSYAPVGDIVLPRSGELTGSVRRAADGEPVGEACVRAFDDDGALLALTMTDGQDEVGRYRFPALPEGPVVVRIGGPCDLGVPFEVPIIAPTYVGGPSFAAASRLAVVAGEPTDAGTTEVRPGGAALVDLRASDNGASFDSRAICARQPDDPPESIDGPGTAFPIYGPASTSIEVEIASCGVLASASLPPTRFQVRLDDDGDLVPTAPPATVEDRLARLGGPSRIETAARISAATFPSAGAVVVARADAYPDALAGAPLAGVVGAPVLLTDTGRLHPAVAAEVARLGATTAYVLGSADALGEEVVEGLRATGVRDVTRLGGVDRFDTARLVAGEVRRLGGATGEAYVVEGANADPARGWPDAVAVASVAAADGVPVLLATTTSLPAATREALGPAESVTVVGGPGAVGDDVLEELRTLADRVTRISGPTRTATSVAVTDERAPGARRVWLATSGNWPDALAAGPAAAADSAALVLVDGAEVTRSPEVLELLDRRDLERVVVTGSVEVLLPNVEVAARDRLNADLLRGSPFESLVLPG